MVHYIVREQMENDDNYMASGFGTALEFSSDSDVHHHHHEHPPPHHHNQQPMSMGETTGHVEKSCGGGIMVDYMLNDQQQGHSASSHNYMLTSSGLLSAASLDRLSFADVMQFGDFGPKLSLNHNYTCSIGFGSDKSTNTAFDPVYFLKFPVLNDCLLEQQEQEHHLPAAAQHNGDEGRDAGHFAEERDAGGHGELLLPQINNPVQVQLQFLGDVDNDDNGQKSAPSGAPAEAKSKRKRPRTIKTSEEVESQRMTHIAVERNRRKQMNEHLHVLRSLMPTTYVQRGDQASIIGGAIEFVRELEQLLQCLESQKRRRLYGEGVGGKAAGDPSLQQQGAPDDNNPLQQSQSAFADPFSGGDHNAGSSFDLDANSTAELREEVAESKSCIADVEVKLLGFVALIKILSRRRPGQLIKAIAAIEDLQFTILHTNITTIEQTVLYSFNVKVASQSRFTAEDIANSVQQIFTFIHANTSSM